VSPLFEVRVPAVFIEASCLRCVSKAHVPSVFEALVASA